MKFSSIAIVALVGSVGAAPLDTRAGYQTDALAAQGAANLAAYVAKNGYPSKQCTLKNVAVRKEWYLLLVVPDIASQLITSQVNTVSGGKDRLHQGCKVLSQKASQDTGRHCGWSQKSLRRFCSDAYQPDNFDTWHSMLNSFPISS